MEGFQTTEVLVTVKSDLDTFLELVQDLTPSSKKGLTRFNPDTQSFINPSRATSSLSVDFTTVSTMLRWMNINDIGDHHTCATKRSMRKNGKQLRILGSSCLITLPRPFSSNSEKSTVLVDCFLPHVSCTTSHIHQLTSLLSDDITTSSQTNPPTHDLANDVVLYRYRENYDPE